MIDSYNSQDNSIFRFFSRKHKSISLFSDEEQNREKNEPRISRRIELYNSDLLKLNKNKVNVARLIRLLIHKWIETNIIEE